MTTDSLAWIAPRRVAVTTRPEGAPAFAALRAAGVRALINLDRRPLPFDLLSRHGFQTEQIPVPSTAAPSPAQIARAVTAIRWYLSAGLPVAVHNGAGPGPAGHAGTVVAGYLVAEGASPEDAAEAVQRAWPGAVEGVSQVAALSAYAMHVRQAVAPGDEEPAGGAAGTGEEAGAPRRPPGRPAVRDPDEALRRLLDGNRRYAADRMVHPRQRAPRRDELAAAQHPFAAMLGCSDSRVPAEIVFDQGLGDLFVVRSAGPVLDSAVVGSLELAVEELAVPLLLVLVHERCRAAGAAVAARKGLFHAPGLVAYVTQAIAPAVEEAARHPGDLVENTLRAHAALVVDSLRRMQPVLAPAVEAGRLRVVGARYDLASGLVEVIVP